MHSAEKTKIVFLCVWLTNFFFVKFTFSAALYQGVPNACNQSSIFVNGQYHNLCSNGYLDGNNSCIPYTMPQCPVGYSLINGFCYLPNQLPTNICPPGFYFSDRFCYPNAAPPCSSTFRGLPPYEVQTQTPPQETTQAHTPAPPLRPVREPAPQLMLPPDPAIHCPPGSIFSHNQCRKMICPMGEYYEGRCLQPACPEGTVWYRHRCQQPGYITSILEIDNIFINEAHHKAGKVVQGNVNNYHTTTPDNIVLTSVLPTHPTSTLYPIPRTTINPTHSPINIYNQVGCCSVLTPRICKMYGQKWVCFNRRYKRCDAHVCKHPKIYLRVPHVTYDPPVLIMPPNPPLEVCSTPDCDNADTVDCSGCQHNRRETCSPHCYRYQCPHDECDFMDLEDYCRNYPSEFGCKKKDGCIWEWCNF